MRKGHVAIPAIGGHFHSRIHYYYYFPFPDRKRRVGALQQITTTSR